MVRRIVPTLLFCLFVAVPVRAQVRPLIPVPPPPVATPPGAEPPGWTASVGAGLAITSGNSDTSTFNLTYRVLHDAGGNIVLRATGVYLRGESDGELNVDRAATDTRLDYRLAPNLSSFGQVGYFRDRFKEVNYLVSPTTGLSVDLVRGPRVNLKGEGSVGFAVEQNTGRGVETNGALLGAETLAIRLSDTARITHGISGLWKMGDLADALYILSAGVTSSMVKRADLKVELLDTYKNRPTDPVLGRNDVSFVVSVVYRLF